MSQHFARFHETPLLSARLCAAALWVCLAIACTSPARTTTEPSANTGPSGRAAAAPVTLHLEGPRSPSHSETIALTAVIVRTSPAYTPLELRWTLPSDAEILSGKQVEVISDSSSTIRRQITIKVAQLPSQDVVAHLSVQRDGFGLSAKAEYRFGRPEPRLPVPTTEKNTTANGRDLGGAIPIEPKPQGTNHDK